LKNNFFLAQNEERQVAFHMALENNDTETLEKKFVWAKDMQTESKYIKENVASGRIFSLKCLVTRNI
jgi:hypothetical protein